ncbi:MAG TPA: helix-turn-helix transcriptional regulator [Kofleriaceae bacterium]|nr:helix-turn-helix transcriptional regulator [Kofleriaceae bacterium]
MIDWRPILGSLLAASAAAREERERAELRERLERARRLIDARYDQPLELEQIARAACLSPYHFHRLFRREFDDTPHQYLTRRRVERARELLLRSDLPITDVCFRVGFQSLGSFSALFRRHAGHSPARYRALVVQSLGVDGPAPLLAPIPSCFYRMFAHPRADASAV